MEEQRPQTPTEEQQTAMKTDNDTGTADRYVFVWRSEGLTVDAKTIDEMIDAYEGATEALRLLKEAGVVLDADASAGDDACLVTTDPAVAQRFEFQLEAAKPQEAQDEMSPGDPMAAKVTADGAQEGTSAM